MIDPSSIRWDSLAAVVAIFCLAIWALRDPESGRSAAAPEASRVGRFRLDSERSGGIVELDDGAVLGRAPDCALCIRERSVSKHHARVVLSPRPHIEDLGSTNGTFVNGRRIDGTSPLRRGDRIALGAAKLAFLGVMLRRANVPKG